MESAEVELVDESRDPTNEVPTFAGAAPARPGRMPSGTLAPPTHDDLEAVRAQAQQLRSILDAGDLDEQEMLDLYARLAQVEGDTLGRTDEAIHAWREVLAIDPSDLRALTALEDLFERDGRPEDSLDVLEKRALLLDDDDERRET